MEILRFLLGVLLPYAAVAVFLAGISYRIYTWKKLASPAMTLFPSPPTEAANRRNAVAEALLFRSLFRGDRVLWVMAWSFHAVLALILVGHLRVLANVDAVLLRLGMTEPEIQAMSGGTGGAAGIVIAVTALLLLLRRAAVPRVREISGLADYSILLPIAAILTTGNPMRFGAEHFDLGLTRAYFAALAGFSGAGRLAALDNGLFLIHMSLAFALIALMPFSKLLHLGGIFFTHQLVRKH
jgi:nitrate reductase gamma subunit